MSLRLRLLLIIAAINVAVLLLILGVGLLASPRSPHPDALQEGFRAALDPDLKEAVYVQYVLRIPRKGSTAEMVGGTGGASDAPLGPEHTEKIEKLRRLWPNTQARYDEEDRGLWIIFPRGAAPYLAAYVQLDPAALQSQRREGLQTIYLFQCAGTVLLILVTYLLLSRMVIRPVEELARASTAAAEGRRPPAVPRSHKGDEMDRLIATFNHMLSEVQEYQDHLEDRVMAALGRAQAAEGRLVVAQRLASTGTLAAGIAHEINNPLGGIVNAVQSLRERGLDDERRERYFRLVLEGLDRIGTIVRRVLDFTPRGGEPQPVDGADVCRRAVDLAQHRAGARNVTLTYSGAAQAQGVIGDPQELQQAVLNLLLNAIDAIPEGRGGVVEAGARREGSEVWIEVEDDGAGMDATTMERCLDLFYSTKGVGEGTGLGLSIVHHIATDHGGTVEIRSAQGEGTRVRIRLPVSEAP